MFLMWNPKVQPSGYQNFPLSSPEFYDLRYYVLYPVLWQKFHVTIYTGSY
jgi:hypothetical protein